MNEYELIQTYRCKSEAANRQNSQEPQQNGMNACAASK